MWIFKITIMSNKKESIMIKRILSIAFLMSLPYITLAKNIKADTSMLAVVLMVKNEAPVICQTIAPYVRAGIHNIMIVDTGSEDETVPVIQQYFEDHNVRNWQIISDPWDSSKGSFDFEIARNRALDFAEEIFPESTFILMPDAEWYMHNVEGLLTFCRAHIDDDCGAYLVRLVNSNIDFPAARLIRNGTNSRFIGDIHEVIHAEKFGDVPSDVYFELGASRMGMEKSRNRWYRDLDRLLARFAKNPEDPRTVFYLAQTYDCLQDFENAYKYYVIRSQLPGWIEETYEALYRLGKITDQLSKNNPNYTWHMAQDFYFAAHALMPHRAEPLIKIAEYYWPDGDSPKNAPLCYLFAKRAYELPYPKQDKLFVYPYDYDFKRYELLSKAAWHVGDYTLGAVCSRKALEYAEMPYLLRNLACYMEMCNSLASSQAAQA
jgi:glycosyltransferase involved in cell wall biosynthesis